MTDTEEPKVRRKEVGPPLVCDHCGWWYCVPPCLGFAETFKAGIERVMPPLVPYLAPKEVSLDDVMG